jgi:erythromycin esterase-like protein
MNFFRAVFLACVCACRTVRVSEPPAAQDADIELLAQQSLQVGKLEPRIVGVGETTHGTLEFRSYAFALVRAAAERTTAGEVTVAVERNGLWAHVVNEWVQGCGNLGGQKSANLPGLYESERVFFHWVREFNAKHHGKKCVRIVGVESPEGTAYLDMVVPFGKRCFGSEWTDELTVEIRQLGRLRGSGDRVVPAADFSSAVSHLPSLQGESRCLDYYWWSRMAQASRQSRGVDLVGVPRALEYVDRDDFLAEGVAYWARMSTKVVFFAHALHVAEAMIPDHRGSSPTAPAGLLLREWFGDDYESVVLLFGAGQLEARTCRRGGGTFERSIPSPGRACIEREFLLNYGDPVLVRLREACRAARCQSFRAFTFCLPLGMRDPRVAYVSVDVEEAFDLAVFFPVVSADHFQR